MIEPNSMIHGDFFEKVKEVPAGSIQLCLQDIPYGITICTWDTVPDLPLMWSELKRIGKPNCAYVFTASQPFTTDLIMSNRKMFKYEWIWSKNNGSNFQNANIMPMLCHENILVFCEGKTIYNPQKQIRRKPKDYSNCKGERSDGANLIKIKKCTGNILRTDKFPESVINIGCQTKECNNVNRTHPTQKPVALFEYLIRTYTNEGDTVFDGFAGSFTTAIACYRTNRNYICIEKELDYYNKGLLRMEEEKRQLKLLFERIF